MQEAPIDLLELAAHLGGEPVDLLIDGDDAFGDELELAYQLVRYHVDVPTGLRRAHRDFVTEVVTNLVTNLAEPAVEIFDELWIHVTTIPTAVRDVKCIVP